MRFVVQAFNPANRTTAQESCAMPFQMPTGLADGLEPESALGRSFLTLHPFAPIGKQLRLRPAFPPAYWVPRTRPTRPDLGGHIRK